MTPEWSRRVPAEEISATPKKMTITASAEECADLARRLRVLSIEDLSAELTLERSSGHIIHVHGSLKARVTQPCVVTLEPVTEAIEKPVEGWFSGEEQVISLTRVRRDRMGAGTDAELPVLDERDDPEPLIEGQVDLGELAAQRMSVHR